MDRGMKPRRKVMILKPWQVKALRNKRTPLPEHPNETPWEELQDGNLIGVLAELSSMGKSKHRDTPKTPKEVSSYYQRWTREEIDLLIRLKREGLSWKKIEAHFPTRTAAGVRQSYWKNRHLLHGSRQQSPTASSGVDTSGMYGDDEYEEDEAGETSIHSSD
ncbi:unnamed protein product [Clonostachys rosea]|uniref:Myb-like domain-containing protein n=1 Tax=Bionectria ochroleuca TaxID=29856 RepID=A0ABY6TZ00_BIOOC|nr:unnamed protein product [Clonostachys rosea]